MRICLVSHEYPPETGGGGIGTQTYMKAHGLAARGHVVHVVSASWDSECRTYRDGDAVVHRIPAPQMRLDWREPSTYWLAYSMAVAEKLTELDRQLAFDIMQFPEYGADGFIYQTECFCERRAKYVVQCHGPLAMFVEKLGWPDPGSAFHEIGCFMERQVLQRADVLMASSNCIAAFSSDSYGIPLERIHVVHSGVDTNRFVPPVEGTTGAWHPKVLFSGNFVPDKGFNLLIETVLRIRKRYPQILLRMIGKGDHAHVLARIEREGAQANVDIRGYVAHHDLPGHYAWCDIFAAPSTYEPGAANVYLEAMSCGRPVIACNTGGAPEAVEQGARGLLISPGSSRELEIALCTLADDHGLRAGLGAAARTWVEQNVSLPRYVDKIEALYTQALSR